MPPLRYAWVHPPQGGFGCVTAYVSAYDAVCICVLLRGMRFVCYRFTGKAECGVRHHMTPLEAAERVTGNG